MTLIILRPYTIMIFYRPQRSCGKVMFSQTSMILFTGGVYPSMHWGRHTPPTQCMLGYTTSPAQRMLGYTPPPQQPLQRTVRHLKLCLKEIEHISDTNRSTHRVNDYLTSFYFLQYYCNKYVGEPVISLIHKIGQPLLCFFATILASEPTHSKSFLENCAAIVFHNMSNLFGQDKY